MVPIITRTKKKFGHRKLIDKWTATVMPSSTCRPHLINNLCSIMPNIRTRPGHCPNRHSQPANTYGVQQRSPCHTARRFEPIPEGEPAAKSIT